MKSIFTRCGILLFFALFTVKAFSQNPPVPVKSDKGWGYTRLDGKQVAGLEHAEPFRHNIGIAKKEGKWGALDLNLNVIIPYKYDEVKSLSENVLLVRNGGQYTLFDHLAGEIGTGPFSDAALLGNFHDTLVVSNLKGLYGIMTSKGKMIVPCKYISPPELLLKSGYLKVMKRKRKKIMTGVVNLSNRVVVPFKYLFVDERYDSLFQCETENGEMIYQSSKGDIIYKGGGKLVSFDDKYVVIEIDGKYELRVRKTGKSFQAESWRKVANQVYYGKEENDHTRIFYPNGKMELRPGTWVVSDVRDGVINMFSREDRDQEYSFVSLDGIELARGRYYGIKDWNRRWAIGEVAGTGRQHHYVLLDLQSGTQALEDAFDRIELMGCYGVNVLKDGKETVLNEKLQEAGNEQNDGIRYYLIPGSDRLTLDRKYAYLTGRNMNEDKEEKDDCGERSVRSTKFRQMDLITDWYGKNPVKNRIKVVAESDNQWKSGIIDFDGKEIVPLMYSSIRFHDNGWIEAALIDSLDIGVMTVWGVIRKNGEVIIEPKYEKIERIADDVAIVQWHGLYNMIDLQTGETVIEGLSGCRFNDDGLFHVGRHGKSGVVDRTGKVIVPLKYKEVSFKPDESGFFKVERDGKKFYVDMNGKEIPAE